jgi:hypothetical protein
MRIREIYDIIIKNEDNINIDATNLGNNNIAISKYDITTKALKNISKIKGLEIPIDELFNKNYGAPAVSDNLIYSSAQYNALTKDLDAIKSSVSLLKNVLIQHVDIQDQNTISLKLYEFENFKEFSDFTTALNNRLFAPLNKLNIDIKVGDFEKGSHWIDIIIGSSLGLSFIVNIVRQSYDILIHDHAKFKVLQDTISHFEKNGTKIEGLDEYLELQINQVYDKRIDNVITGVANDKILSPEEVQIINKLEADRLNELKSAIKFSIDETSKQIEKGLRIYQALDIPEEKRYKLPTYKQLSLKKKNDEIENE